MFLILCLFVWRIHSLSLPLQHSHWHRFPDCSIIRDIKSDPLQSEKKGGRENTRIFIWIYTSNNLTKTRDGKKKTKTKTQKKNREAQTFHRANRRRRGTKLKTHTHTHKLTHARLPDTQLTLTDKHTKKQRTQSPAQPEVYFMQKYSKVCFTIQLNIKGGYIPLWSLTPQWTNPTLPPPPIHLQHTEKVGERHC